MKTTMNRWKLATLVLIASLGIVVGTPALHNQASAETQPTMASALAELKDAQAFLETPTGDKGGHRAKALKATKKAIAQVTKGIDFDNAH